MMEKYPWTSDLWSKINMVLFPEMAHHSGTGHLQKDLEVLADRTEPMIKDPGPPEEKLKPLRRRNKKKLNL